MLSSKRHHTGTTARLFPIALLEGAVRTFAFCRFAVTARRVDQRVPAGSRGVSPLYSSCAHAAGFRRRRSLAPDGAGIRATCGHRAKSTLRPKSTATCLLCATHRLDVAAD